MVREAGDERAAGEEGEMGEITQKWSIFSYILQSKKNDKGKKGQEKRGRDPGLQGMGGHPRTLSRPPLLQNVSSSLVS